MLRDPASRLELLEAAMDQANDMVLITSLRGLDGPDPVVLIANRAFERVTGWTVEEIVGGTLQPLMHPDTDAAAVETIYRALANREPASFEVLVRHRDGSPLWLDASLCMHGDEEHEQRCVWIVRDVTERRRLQDKLIDTARMDAVGRLAGSLAHDFNNLITVIASSTQLARWRLGGDDAMQGYLREIEMATGRAQALTGQLLAVSRKGGMHPQVLDAGAALRDITPLLRRLVGQGVELCLSLPAPGPLVRADRAHIEQVLLNLVANARDAMPSGGRVEISVESTDEEARIIVSDTGQGMDAATVLRATEAFFTTKPRGSGTGLGLSTVQSIAERHGGRVELTSQLHEGTTVTVILPRVSAAAAVRHREASPAVLEDQPVLLVEDDPSLRGLLVAGLRRAGFEVREHDGSGSVERLVEDGPYRLVISDLHLGPHLASDLLLALREVQPELPVLCISGYDPVDAGLEALTPAVDLLRKPFNLTQLAEAIERTLHAPRPVAA
jgi:PAS domain S-box-containing protein